MSEWYYATGLDQHLGPLSSTDLVAEFRQGRIGQQTLVWREGQAQWQPLADVSAELGLNGETGAVLPPPLPTSSVPAPPPLTAPPLPGLPGCMIALMVAAALAVLLGGILAMIAVPAYQQYVVRAKVAAALAIAGPHKTAIALYLARKQTCPENDDDAFAPPASYAQGSVGSITFGRFESDLCGMEVILALPGNEPVDGKALWLEYNPANASWHCSSEIDDRVLPSQCRG